MLKQADATRIHAIGAGTGADEATTAALDRPPPALQCGVPGGREHSSLARACAGWPMAAGVEANPR